MIRQALRCGSLFFMRLAFGVLPPHDSMVLYDKKRPSTRRVSQLEL